MPIEPAPAPADNDAFDEWARAASDGWQRSQVYAEATRRWSDPSLPLEHRALAAAWASPVGIPPVAELGPLADEPGLDAVLQARLRTALAAAVVGDDPAAASALMAQAVDAVSDPEVPIRTRLSVWLAASEVAVRTNRPADAVQILDAAGPAVKADATSPPWAVLAIDAERLSILALRSTDHKHLAGAANTIAEAARAVPPTPTAVDVIVRMGGLLARLGAARLAETHMEAVLQITEGLDETVGVRYQAHSVLAEVLFGLEGPEAAMAAQRQAIATVEPLGDTPMLAAAHRGLAMHLGALDRHGDAAAEFGAGAEVFQRLGMPYEAAALRYDRAAALLHDGEPAAARELAEQVSDDTEALPDDRRAPLEMRYHEVMAQVAAYDGELEQAADHWLEVADVAGRVGVSPLEAMLTAAQLFAASDDMDEAEAQFGRAELRAADEPDPAQATAMVMRLRAEALRDAGRAGDAAELARVAANHARTAGDEAQAIYLSVIAADSLHADGQSPAAVQLYGEILAAAREAGMPALEGVVHAAYAELLRGMGRVAEADEHDRLAVSLGAGPDTGGSETLPG